MASDRRVGGDATLPELLDQISARLGNNPLLLDRRYPYSDELLHNHASIHYKIE